MCSLPLSTRTRALGMGQALADSSICQSARQAQGAESVGYICSPVIEHLLGARRRASVALGRQTIRFGKQDTRFPG